MADERGPVRRAMEEGRSYTPLADKFAAKSPGAKNLAEPDEFKHTHYYNPIGWDRIDPKPHPGSSTIKPGSPIQRIGNMGPGKGGGKLAFVHVRDPSGNNQSISRGSLASKKKFETQMAEEHERAANPPEPLGNTAYHKHLGEEAEAWHEKYFPGFHDRRTEGRRDKPI
jgi:hypothetical protein